MNYEVIYLTVHGWCSLPSRTLQEAEEDKKRLEDLNKLPGNWAGGIKIRKILL